MPQFGNDFVFTFVDEHSLVGVDYIAEEEHEPAPVHEDGFYYKYRLRSCTCTPQDWIRKRDWGWSLDDVDTLAEVLNDYFTL